MTATTITAMTAKEWRNLNLNLRHELSYLYLEEKRNDGCPGMGASDA